MPKKEVLLSDVKGRVAVGEPGDGVLAYRKSVRPDGKIVLEPIQAEDTPEPWMRRIAESQRKESLRRKKSARAKPDAPIETNGPEDPLIIYQTGKRKRVEFDRPKAKKIDSSERLKAAAETLPSRKQRRLAKFSLAELTEQRRKARAAVNPSAFKACQFLSTTLKTGIPIIIAGFCGLVFLFGMVGGKMSTGQGAFLGLMAAGIVGVFALMGLARLLLTALFFSRYSLSDMLYFLLSLNFMCTLLVIFPNELKLLPALGLIYVAAMPFSYFLAQDPEGDDFLPPFIRQRMMEDRAKARANQKKIANALEVEAAPATLETANAN